MKGKIFDEKAFNSYRYYLVSYNFSNGIKSRSSEFPNTIYEVVYQKNQFSPAKYIETTTPTQTQYDVVDEVLTEIYPVLNKNVLFFSTKQYNDLLYEQIGDHYFCYSTKSYKLQKGSQQ